MSDWKLHTPNGAYDILPDECARKNEIENTITAVTASMGYREIETPTFEYYDCYAGSNGQISQESMIKFFDEQGRILALRPDITTSIARMAATKQTGSAGILRYSYTGSVFRSVQTEGARQREFTQSGIELIGSYSPAADAEVIAASIEAILALGIEEFQVEIGQVAFFRGLMEQTGLKTDQIEQLCERIDSKDTVGIRAIISSLNIDSTVKNLIVDLPYLFGGPEILDKADIDGLNSVSKAALENLRRIYEILCSCGYGKFISLDLGMLQSISYYTGSIFKCYTHGVGFPICAGGRYDNLLGKFGEGRGAVGVAFGINRIMTALRSLGDDGSYTPSPILMFTEPGAEAAGYQLSYTLRSSGYIIEQYVGGGDYITAENYARAAGLSSVLHVFADGRLKILDFAKNETTDTTIKEFTEILKDDDYEE